ncbi:methyltransferase domain-containing protein [Saccharomonospora sp. NPDC046836]|uniref:methyltransferase domain-containing protein n=1 Tax=Saccharomonospora sp. NPDC046836 TaxID=3156921 RepID=UPI0033D25E54
MTGAEPARPAAIQRALPLLDPVPPWAEVTDGYLDLVGERAGQATGPVQELWQSALGTAVYQPLQRAVRTMFTFLRLPTSALRLQAGAFALDVGCGPGSVTAELGWAVGPDGLAVGVDISAPMLKRAASVHTAPNVGFLRADAGRLPVRDDTFHGVTCLAMLQLVPEPAVVLAELARVLTPGGRLVIMVPTATSALARRVARVVAVPWGVLLPPAEDIVVPLRAHGIAITQMRQTGLMLQVVGHKAE